MSAATGLSDLDVAILTAVAAGPGNGLAWEKSDRALRRLPDDLGLGPLAAYEELCALATPWRSPLPLLEPNGNFGEPGGDHPSASARYTECRLSAAGVAALAAERGDGPPAPFGLVLGDWFRGGRRPPFDPGRVAAAVRFAAADSVPDGVRALGAPAFPGGLPLAPARLGDDPRALEYGWLVRCRVTARLVPAADGPRGRYAVDIVALPPGTGTGAVASRIADLATALSRAGRPSPIAELDDLTSARTGTQIRVIAAPGADPAAVDALLRAVPGVYAEFDLQLPYPADELLGRWVAEHGAAAATAGADVLAGLTRRADGH